MCIIVSVISVLPTVYECKMESSLLILMILVYVVEVTNATTIENTKLLLQDLFLNYSKDVIPVKNQSRPVAVSMDLDAISINDFDEVAGTIDMVIILSISWNDDNLVWNAASYDNKTSLTFSQNKVWLPQMFLLNPVESSKPISHQYHQVTVTHTGRVLWMPGAVLEATCTPDISKFPFDQHTCALNISPWGFSAEQVTLTIPSPTMLFRYYTTNSEWDVIGSTTHVLTGTFHMAKYSFTVKRRHLNFMISVVIPIIMLALVNPFVFILPFNSGERASYSITVLLAFTVYMTVVSDRMPPTSYPMSILAFYILFILVCSVLIVIANIFQTRLYDKDDTDQPIPQYITRPVMCLRLIFRSNRINTKHLDVGKQGSDNNKGQTTKGGENISSVHEVGSMERTEESELNTEHVLDCKTTNSAKLPTWRMIAKTTDLIFFVVFLLITVTFTIAFFIAIM
ncbi:acetylcholine receptor subunit beta-type unc-29-like [Argopecten irradians]|uniref:acetylcholine receptor subunit beta-type unc-29-like n=1 Tax=Argopecten irradians TaxID=31199 RepID=UPI003720B110